MDPLKLDQAEVLIRKLLPRERADRLFYLMKKSESGTATETEIQEMLVIQRIAMKMKKDRNAEKLGCLVFLIIGVAVLIFLAMR